MRAADAERNDCSNTRIFSRRFLGSLASSALAFHDTTLNRDIVFFIVGTRVLLPIPLSGAGCSTQGMEAFQEHGSQIGEPQIGKAFGVPSHIRFFFWPGLKLDDRDVVNVDLEVTLVGNHGLGGYRVAENLCHSPRVCFSSELFLALVLIDEHRRILVGEACGNHLTVCASVVLEVGEGRSRPLSPQACGADKFDREALAGRGTDELPLSLFEVLSTGTFVAC